MSSQGSGKPTLHHLNNSQSQRVLWLLEELDIPYELVLHTREPSFVAPKSLVDATPMGKAPTLITAEGEAIVESSAIIAYLIKRYDTKQQFTGASLGEAAFLRDEVLASFCGATLMPLNFMRTLTSLGALSDNTKGALFGSRTTAALDFLEEQLGDHDYFMGTSPGRADFLLSYPLDVISQREWAQLGPKLKSWHQRVLDREGWKRGIKAGKAPYDLASIKAKS